MSDRITGLLIAALAVWYGWTASGFEEGFGDPVGPSAFPEMLAVPMGVFALFLVVKPDPEPNWPHGRPLLRQLGMVATLIAYPLVLEPLGFPIATALGGIVMSLLLGGPRRGSAISAVAVALGLFVTFDTVLGLHLPLLPSFK